MDIRYQVDKTLDGDVITPIHKIVIKRFKIREIDMCPSSCIVQLKLQEWWTSDPGKFILNKCMGNITTNYQYDHLKSTQMCAIIVDIKEKDLSEYYLKWGLNGDN